MNLVRINGEVGGDNVNEGSTTMYGRFLKLELLEDQLAIRLSYGTSDAPLSSTWHNQFEPIPSDENVISVGNTRLEQASIIEYW